jgi:hypothetical protein
MMKEDGKGGDFARRMANTGGGVKDGTGNSSFRVRLVDSLLKLGGNLKEDGKGGDFARRMANARGGVKDGTGNMQVGGNSSNGVDDGVDDENDEQVGVIVIVIVIVMFHCVASYCVFLILLVQLSLLTICFQSSPGMHRGETGDSSEVSENNLECIFRYQELILTLLA